MTLRIGALDEGSTSLDHEATWLLGHTEHITFSELWHGEGDLYVDAVLHVPCRHLRADGGVAHCTAHGFTGSLQRPRRRAEQPRRLGGDRFKVVDDMQAVTRALPTPPAPRGLPVLGGDNPCATAQCRTSDHRRGAACCRDLQVEIMCTRRERRLEALVRSRRSPYLCKVTRPGDFSLEAEMISACGYLAEDGIACSLHGRVRADGRPAKPDLCSDWPPKDKGLHPGCVFAPRSRRRG
ncbi:MAG: hypothetical protein ACREOC_11390 [Gemmatimonadales bacterium]